MGNFNCTQISHQRSSKTSSGQDNLVSVMENRATTLLTNTVMWRRDIVLATNQGKQLQDESIVDV